MIDSEESYAENVKKRKEAERERILKQIEDDHNNRLNKKESDTSNLKKNAPIENFANLNPFTPCLLIFK
jgi:hypothetical protein